MKDKKKHKYLVGFIGDNRCVYGKDVEVGSHFEASYTRPMTILQAKRQLKQLNGKTKTVYELKPISNLAIRVRTEMRTKRNKP